MSSLFGSSVSRKNAYSKSDDAGASREERMNRLKFELREHIRFLADYELLSSDWLRMAESLHQIANVAFMETHLPAASENPLTQQGKKDTGTLWDQERDELAVRILLEEGKLNLALRILHKYRAALRDSDKFTDAVKATSEKFNSDAATVLDRCKVFEQSVGLLLQFAFRHVEALQIMDVPQFIAHCGEVMAEAAESSATHSPLSHSKLQETLVLHYLAGLASALEDMDEDRVMDLVQDAALVPTLLRHLNAHYEWYGAEALESACKFLNGALGSEACQAERARFLPDAEAQANLANLRPLFLSELLSPALSDKVSIKRKDVQTLLDEIARAERSPARTAAPAPAAAAVSGSLKERLDKWRLAEQKEKDKAASATPAAAPSESKK